MSHAQAIGKATDARELDQADVEDDGPEAPSDTAYKQWSCHSGHKLLSKLYRTFPPPAMGARFTVLGKPAMRTRWMAGVASHKKRVMSRLIQVRQHHTNKSGLVISAINKYMLGIGYP